MDLGTVQIYLSNGHNTTVSDVLHVLALEKSSISVCKATLQCQSIEFFHNYSIIKHKNINGKPKEIRFNQVSNLYPLAHKPVIQNSTSMAITKISPYDAMK